MSTIISKDFNFAMGHVLPLTYEGKCRQFHGHNYDLRVEVSASKLDKNGFVMDFGDLKTIVNKIIDDELDHRFMIQRTDSRAAALGELDKSIMRVEFIPTAENIASYLFKRIGGAVAVCPGILLNKIELFETPTSRAVVNINSGRPAV